MTKLPEFEESSAELTKGIPVVKILNRIITFIYFLFGAASFLIGIILLIDNIDLGSTEIATIQNGKTYRGTICGRVEKKHAYLQYKVCGSDEIIILESKTGVTNRAFDNLNDGVEIKIYASRASGRKLRSVEITINNDETILSRYQFEKNYRNSEIRYSVFGLFFLVTGGYLLLLGNSKRRLLKYEQ